MPLEAGSPTFQGNPEDLDRFKRLAGTPIRSDERERALRGWEEYKLVRQLEGTSTSGVRTKGAYLQALTRRVVDLRGATFDGVCLGHVDLRGVQLDDAKFLPGTAGRPPWTALKGAKLENASLRRASLREARLMHADLRNADLSGADLTGANLQGTNLTGANLTGAQLEGADLTLARLVGTKLAGAKLSRARVYGVAVWDIEVCDDDTLRRDLVVTPEGQPEVTVDSLEVAHFVYLLLTNAKIRAVLDTVCKRGVLILGRFTSERKAVLDSLRDALRQRGFVPMVFDFTPSSERSLTETVQVLVGMSRFVIADITNPRSSPLELQATIPSFMVPFVPIIERGEEPFPMFKDLWRKHREWVLDPLVYDDREQLLLALDDAIIEPALEKHAQLLALKAQTEDEPWMRSAADHVRRR